jgi:outer membrane protein assembly factor BamB
MHPDLTSLISHKDTLDMAGKQVWWVLPFLLTTTLLWAANWPQFRGPNSHGIASEKNLPVVWTEREIRWKTPLAGPGHSSPIVWGNRIFLTAFRPDTSISRFFGARTGKLLVVSIDKNTGKILWETEVPAERIEEVHSTNAPASPTPVTDGRYVYVYFGSKGLLAFDFDGKRIWEVRLGPFPNEWGSASSPILYNNMVILNCDTDADDFLIAVDKNTGKTIWRTSRNGATRSWAVPYIWSAGGKDEIVVSGSGRVRSYDPKDGRELWSAGGLTRWVTPTPVSAHGLLYVASNGPGGNLIMAIKPGGRGDVTNSHVVWRYTGAAPYNASPLVVGAYLYAVRNGGVIVCLDAKTGAQKFLERLPAQGSYYASPVYADGRIYTLSEDGEVTALAPKPELQVLGTSKIGERCMASPAVSDGRIIVRSDKTLYSIGQ